MFYLKHSVTRVMGAGLDVIICGEVEDSVMKVRRLL